MRVGAVGEMAANWYYREKGEQIGGASQDALPKTVIYDPELVVTLPASLSATSGLNAMAHAAEALYAKGTAFADVIKMGRTQLQDAVPMTLGQEC